PFRRARELRRLGIHDFVDREHVVARFYRCFVAERRARIETQRVIPSSVADLPLRGKAWNRREVLIEGDERLVNEGQHLPFVFRIVKDVVERLDVVLEPAREPAAVARRVRWRRGRGGLRRLALTGDCQEKERESEAAHVR